MHAVLSPSGASRWLVCTPSAQLEQSFANTSSEYAKEGTLAHAIAELILNGDEDFDVKLSFLQQDELYTPIMLEHASDFADYVMAQCTDTYKLFVERKLDMTNYVPEGFGTADAIVIKNQTLKLNDLKYGKGVPVYADNNKQLMLYALGALNDFGHLYDIQEIELHIFQPRIDNISSWAITTKELIHWAETELKAKAIEAYHGTGEFVPGNHCGFCRAKGQCKALATFNMSLAALEFKNPDILTDEELVDILSKKSLFDTWLEAVHEYAFQTALNGKQWPGYKLVEGRSNRKYGNEEDVVHALTANNIKDFYQPQKLYGITEMEKRVGKALFSEIIAPLLIKPQGKPTLVPASDKRAPITSAETDFKE